MSPVHPDPVVRPFRPDDAPAAAVKVHAELDDPVEAIDELFKMNEQYRLDDKQPGR